MANPKNRFLNDKDRKKAETDIGNVYSQQIDESMRRGMAAEWQPTSNNNIKRGGNLPSLPNKNNSTATNYVNELKKKDEEKRFSEQKKEEAAAKKKSNNPYVRMGKTTQEEADKRQAIGKEKYSQIKEKYPIVNQADAVFNHTIRPATEGMLKAAGDTIGEVATIGNKEGKENLRNYLSERENAQHGLEKAVYKTSEIGTNLALMSTVSNKLPFLGKLDKLTKSGFVNRALREGAENVIIGAATDFAKGETEDFGMNRLKDFGSGAAFGVGMEGLGRIGKKASGLLGKAQNIPYDPPKFEPKAEPEVIEPINFDPKIKDNEQLNILEQPKAEEPKIEIPRPLTNTIPKPPTKYELNNPSGKMKPHIVGGSTAEVKKGDINGYERDIFNVGKINVKSMGFSHPELREHIEPEAQALKEEYNRFRFGGRGDILDENGTIIDNMDFTANAGSEDINSLLGMVNLTPKQRKAGVTAKDLVGKAIDDVIEDGGKENYALAKKVEMVIDNRLTKGYTDDMYGEYISPSENYKYAKNEIYGQGENYSKIPKLSEREKILERFNQEYGHIPSQQPPQPQNITGQVNIPSQVKTSPQANSEVLKPVNNVVDNVKNIPTKIDEDTLLEQQLEAEKVINAGKKVKLEKFGECEIVEETDGQIRLKNARGTEFTIGEAAYEKLKIAENKPQQPSPSTNVTQQVKDSKTLELERLEAEHKKYIETTNKMPMANEEMKQKNLKGEAMRYSAEKRKVIQGDSLDPVEGGLTPKELENKINQLKKNTVGKNIMVEGKEATIKSNAYGKIKVEFKDGTTKTYSSDDIPKELPLEYKNKGTVVEPKPQVNSQPKPPVNSETAYTELGDTAVSKMRTNTYAKAEFMQDEQAKKVVERISGEYEVLHDKDLIASAKMELENDFDNVTQRLMKKSEGLEHGLMDAKDITQAGLITNKLIEESKTTGNTELLKKWLRGVRLQATSLGQAVHSISTWKKQSPEGMLLKTQRTIDNVIENMRKTNPKQLKKAETMAEETKVIVNDILNKIQQTEPKKPIEEILDNPSPKISKIIEDATKNTDKKVKEVIEEAAKNKELKNITKMAEKVLEKNGVPSLTDNDIKFITEKMEKIQGVNNSREKDIEFALIKKMIAEKIPATTKDKILAAQRINLLLNTKTNIRNIVGNVVMGGLENVKDIVATPIDKAVSMWTGQRTTTIPTITEQLKGFVKGIKEGFEDAKLGIDTSKMSGRYSDMETNKMYDIPKAQAFRKIDNPKTVIDHLNNLASGSEKLTHTLLSMGDRPFFEAAFSGSIAKQLKLNGGEVTEEMVNKAIKEAEERTFQNVNDLTKGMQMLKTGMNWIGKKVTGTEFNIGDVALPFIKTPANILDKAIDYSPIGGIQGFAKIVKGINTGALDQKAAVDQLARGLTGTSLIFAGYELAKNGVIFGKGANDKDAKALEQQAGRLPYSFKSGDTYSTIDWIQPAAIPLMIGADIYEQKKSDKEAKNIILNAVKSGGKTLFDQSLLTGLSDLFGGYGNSGGDRLMEGLKDTAMNGLNQFVPYGSALSQVTKFTDKNVRNTYDADEIKSNLVNKPMSKIPFLSDDLPKKYSTVGQEVKQNYGATGIDNVFQTLINPSRTGKFNPTAAEKMALEIYDRSGETIQIPRVAAKTINYKTDDGSKNGKKEVLNLKGKDYSEYQRILGEKTEKAFEDFSKTQKYNSMTDSEKAKELQKIMTEVKSYANEEMLDNKKIKYKK